MSSVIAKRFVVHGRVQVVFFGPQRAIGLSSLVWLVMLKMILMVL